MIGRDRQGTDAVLLRPRTADDPGPRGDLGIGDVNEIGEPNGIEAVAGDGQGPRVGREGRHPDLGGSDLDATEQSAVAAVPDADEGVVAVAVGGREPAVGGVHDLLDRRLLAIPDGPEPHRRPAARDRHGDRPVRGAAPAAGLVRPRWRGSPPRRGGRRRISRGPRGGSAHDVTFSDRAGRSGRRGGRRPVSSQPGRAKPLLWAAELSLPESGASPPEIHPV